MLPEDETRIIEQIRLPLWGRVVASEGLVPWQVEDDLGGPVKPIAVFLRDFVARGRSPGSVRSYALALLRWWRFLVAVGMAWDKATSTEVKDFVLWLRQVQKPVASARVTSKTTAGRVNPLTRKQALDDDYKPATIRHSNAVLRTFYDFWLERGEGPLVNPVVRERVRGRRGNAHHNPLESFRAEGRLRYNPRLPKRKPRSMPDDRWEEFFQAMGSNRDRALASTYVSTAARASELLGMRGHDIDWGDQLVRVVRKGTRAEQWLPASPDTFVWLRRYVAEVGQIGPDDPVWQTLYRRDGKRLPLNYDALRAVFRRANTKLGTNWTVHDLRHTCAIRLVRDGRLSLRDVQTILGHAHLTTTQIYLEADEEEVFARVRQHQADGGTRRLPAVQVGGGYDATDMNILFGDQT